MILSQKVYDNSTSTVSIITLIIITTIIMMMMMMTTVMMTLCYSTGVLPELQQEELLYL